MPNGFSPPPAGQECLITCMTSQGGVLRANCLKLTRQYVVFEVYSPASVLLISEVLSEFNIILRDRTIYSGKAVVKKSVNTGILEVCEAELNDGWLDVDLFVALADKSHLSEEFRNYLQEWQKQYKVLPEFKLHIADMQMFFMELRLWLDQVELGIRAAPAGDRERLESEITGQLSASVIPQLNGLFEKFEELAKGIDEELKPLHRAYMKRQLHPLVLCSPFAYRTFTKPLGYPGDYEMVNMIWRNGHEGGSLYAKVVNCWFLNQPPAVAHRNRIEYLTQRLAEETVRVNAGGNPARLFNVACGPAVEVQCFLREWNISDRAEISLLDFNQETLDHASFVLDSIKRGNARTTQIHLIKKSIQQILKEAGKVVVRPANVQYDLVYCAGLFDYLPDPICQRLMNILYRWIAPGGLLLVTNVDACNPLRHGMDYLLDWALVYRTARQAMALQPADAPPDSLSVKSDSSGVDLFIEVRKPSHV